LGAPALTQTYRNTDWGFSLRMPADFSAYPSDGNAGRDENGNLTGETIVLQNPGGDAVQIEVTPDNRASADNTFTADDLAREAPYIDPTTAQSVQLPQDVTGISFTLTGSAAAYGTSTDVLMFTYRDNLYEVTADTKDRALFEAIMDTWRFE
jgi:hypothetical protein